MKWLAGIALALLLSSAANAGTEVEEVGGSFFHIYHIASGADTTLKLADFDLTGDGRPDCSKLIKIGLKNGTTGGPDSLGYPNSAGHWNWMAWPGNSSDAVPMQFLPFSEIRNRTANGEYTTVRAPHTLGAAPSDSAVIRVKSIATGSDVYLYVWGS